MSFAGTTHVEWAAAGVFACVAVLWMMHLVLLLWRGRSHDGVVVAIEPSPDPQHPDAQVAVAMVYDRDRGTRRVSATVRNPVSVGDRVRLHERGSRVRLVAVA